MANEDRRPATRPFTSTTEALTDDRERSQAAWMFGFAHCRTTCPFTTWMPRTRRRG
jgi:cytochrome oxidase Cu insertion factor (SCO1/SenC/PrrC family)